MPVRGGEEAESAFPPGVYAELCKDTVGALGEYAAEDSGLRNHAFSIFMEN